MCIRYMCIYMRIEKPPGYAHEEPWDINGFSLSMTTHST